MKTALFDFDGTLSKGYISLGFMQYIHDKKLYRDEDYKHQQSILDEYKAGERSYDSWVEEWGKTWAHGLAGQKQSEVRQAAHEFFETFRDQIYPESATLVHDLKDHGYKNVMVSAGVFEVIDEARKSLGLEQTIATQAEVVDGLYSGLLATQLHLPTGKVEALQELIAKNGAPDFAFGDSSGDIGMLQLSKTPVCLNPHQDLADVAAQHGWLSLNIDQAPQALHRILEKNEVQS